MESDGNPIDQFRDGSTATPTLAELIERAVSNDEGLSRWTSETLFPAILHVQTTVLSLGLIDALGYLHYEINATYGTRSGMDLPVGYVIGLPLSKNDRAKGIAIEVIKILEEHSDQAVAVTAGEDGIRLTCEDRTALVAWP